MGGRVRAAISMSLDEFIAGPGDGSDRPLGEGGGCITHLSFGVRAKAAAAESAAV